MTLSRWLSKSVPVPLHGLPHEPAKAKRVTDWCTPVPRGLPTDDLMLEWGEIVSEKVMSQVHQILQDHL